MTLLSEQRRQHYTPLRTLLCPECEGSCILDGAVCRTCDAHGWIAPVAADLTLPKVEPNLYAEPTT